MKSIASLMFAVSLAGCFPEGPPSTEASGNDDDTIDNVVEVLVTAVTRRAYWDSDNHVAVATPTEEVEGAQYVLSNGNEVLDGVTTDIIELPSMRWAGLFEHEENNVVLTAEAVIENNEIVGTLVPRDFVGEWTCITTTPEGEELGRSVSTITDNATILLDDVGRVVPQGTALLVSDSFDSVASTIPEQEMLGVMLDSNSARFHVVNNGVGHLVVDCRR